MNPLAPFTICAPDDIFTLQSPSLPMAQARINHPDFGTREEDWPELDIDSDTEEYREKQELFEAALSASIHRSIAKQEQQTRFPHIPPSLYLKAKENQDQLTMEERSLLVSRGDLIGKALGDLASITDEEMHKLFSWPPPDVVRANIQRVTGGSFTTPTELYAKMKEAIDHGELVNTFSDETIRLVARRFHALDDATFNIADGMQFAHVQGWGEAMSVLRSRQEGLDMSVFMACSIYSLDSRTTDREEEPAWVTAMKESLRVVPEAVNDVCGKMMGLHWERDTGVLSDQDLVSRSWEHLASLKVAAGPQPISYLPLSTLIGSLSSIEQEQGQGKVAIEEVVQRIKVCLTDFETAMSPKLEDDSESILPSFKPLVSGDDRIGTGHWPRGSQPVSPYGLYLRETPTLSGRAAEEAWAALNEAERVAYRAQKESLRLAAWETQHQASIAADEPALPSVVAGEPEPPSVPASEPELPKLLQPFRLYCQELGAGVEFAAAAAGWSALPTTQRDAYKDRADARNKAIMAEGERLAHLKPRPVQDDKTCSGYWPEGSRHFTPYGLFLRQTATTTTLSGLAAEEAWAALSDVEKAAYRVKKETLRLIAWRDHQHQERAAAKGISTVAPLLPSRDQVLAMGIQEKLPQLRKVRRYERNPVLGPDSVYVGGPEMPGMTTGLRVYRDEVAVGVEFETAVAGWDALTTTQWNEYEAKAAERDKVARAKFQKEFDAFLHSSQNRCKCQEIAHGDVFTS